MAVTKRILIADDHDVIRRGLRTLLESRQDINVVAEASNGRQALALARESTPDIAILDYSLPELNGRDLTIELRKLLPRLEVLIFTMHHNESLVHDVLEAGARGYLLKTEAEHHIVKGARTGHAL